MPNNWNRAFGLYLRTLRERRGLSLHDVASLSQAFAETLNKGYLSRCENGHQRLALSKVIPLSRIYETSADVLLERIELDMELERVGAPDTEGMDFSELTEAGTDALNRGYKWKAYGCLRDSTARAAIDPVRPAFRDVEEQVVCAYQNCATAASALGRQQYALHEFLFAKETGATGPRFFPVLLERLSSTYRRAGDIDQARRYADDAVTEAERFGEVSYLGYAYMNRATVAYEDSDLERAAAYYEKAYKAYQRADRPHECGRSLHNLAQVHFDLGRYRASRRALLAAGKVMQPLEQHRTLALGRILMGELDALESHQDRATKHWREAVSIAKRLDDKVLRFKAEYLLLKQACENGNLPVARSIQRRLRKLSNWVPKTTPELRDFEALSDRLA